MKIKKSQQKRRKENLLVLVRRNLEPQTQRKKKVAPKQRNLRLRRILTHLKGLLGVTLCIAVRCDLR